jgi:hypothetical protein
MFATKYAAASEPPETADTTLIWSSGLLKNLEIEALLSFEGPCFW